MGDSKCSKSGKVFSGTYLAPDERAELARVAAEEDRSLASVIRVAIREYLDRRRTGEAA